MPRWLYLWPLNFVAAGYLAFGAIFLFMRKRSRGKTRKADRSSVIAIFIQAFAFAIAWMTARKPFTPFLPVTAAAVRTLGQQWSLQARVLEHHELIRHGPCRIVRHPIYAGMFGMLVAGSLAHGHWLGLLIASLVYCIGTIIRIRSEEKLLREQFGSAYEEYAREVPAFIPLGGTRAVVSKKF